MRSLIKEVFFMKKLCITLILIAIIVLSGIAQILPQNQVQKEYLRIHVRANSNSELDQSVKYLVKNKVVEYLTPFIAECDTKQKAERMLLNNLCAIENIASTTLKSSGFSYSAKASLERQAFPTRTYGDLELKAGVYDALILELGDAMGDNWWCVVYPPLCFVGEGQSVVYRSKILQVISDFFEKKE